MITDEEYFLLEESLELLEELTDQDVCPICKRGFPEHDSNCKLKDLYLALKIAVI